MGEAGASERHGSLDKWTAMSCAGTRIEMIADEPGESQQHLMERGETGGETRSVNRHLATARVPYIGPREGGGGRGREVRLASGKLRGLVSRSIGLGA
jgi:hypothetical protein